MMRWVQSAYDPCRFVSVWKGSVSPDSPLRAYHATLRLITTPSVGWLIGYEVQVFHNWLEEPVINDMRFRVSEEWPFIHNTIVKAIQHVVEVWNPVRLNIEMSVDQRVRHHMEQLMEETL